MKVVALRYFSKSHNTLPERNANCMFGNKLIIPIGQQVHFIPIEEFLYAYAESNYIHIITKTKKYFLAKTLKWLESQIKDNQIMRIHRTYLINTNEILTIDKSTWTLELSNNVIVTVARNYRSFFQDLT